MSIEVFDEQRVLVNTKFTEVAFEGGSLGDSFEVLQRASDEIMIEVEIMAGKNQVQLPNGFSYNAGDTALLTVRQLDDLNPAVIGTVVQINGPVGVVSAAGVIYETTEAS